MLQGPYEPYKGKTLIQSLTSSIVFAIGLGLLVTALPSFLETWLVVSVILGFFYIIFSILCKLEFTKSNLWIKFMPGWISDIYFLMLSMRAFSYLFSNDVVGVIFPSVSFILTGLAASFATTEKLPSAARGHLQVFGERLNKIALIFVSTAGVLGASFGMFMARTGRMGLVMLFLGIMSYILSLGIAYPLFKQFINERRNNGKN